MIRSILAVDAPHVKLMAVWPAHQVVDRHDRRVFELALNARFAHEARERVGLLRVLRPQHLHRHVAADALVVAEEDLPHAAFAEHFAFGVACAFVNRVWRETARFNEC